MELQKVPEQIAYDLYGYERCDSIYATPFDAKGIAIRDQLSDDALSAMDRNMLGMRFKLWKPDSVALNPNMDRTAQLPNSRKTYCYLFKDTDPAYTNPVSGVGQQFSCTERDLALLSNVPFVTKVFPDANPDYPHVLPVNKCVWEIDESKVDAQGLNTFWKNFSGLECESYKAKATDINNDLAGILGASNATRTALKNELTNSTNEYNALRTQTQRLQHCTRTNEDITASTTKINTKYARDVTCQWEGQGRGCAPGDKTTLTNSKNDRSSAREQAASQKATAYSAYQTLQRRTTQLTTENAFLTTQVNTLSESFRICNSNELPQVTQSNELLRDSIRAYKNEIAKLQEDLNKIKAQIPDVSTKNNQLRTQIRMNSDNEVASLGVLYGCQSSLVPQQRIIEEYKPEVLRLRRLKQQCDADLANAADLYTHLLYLWSQLSRENQSFNSNISSYQRQYSEFVDKFVNAVRNDPSFTCANEYVTYSSNLSNLIAKKDDLMSSNQEAEYVAGIANAQWCGNPANSNYIISCCPKPKPPAPSNLCQVFQTDKVFDINAVLWTKDLIAGGGIRYGGNGRGNENPKLADFYNTGVAVNPPYVRLWYSGWAQPVEVRLGPNQLQPWTAPVIKGRTHLQFTVDTNVFEPQKSGRETISVADGYPIAAQFVNCMNVKS